MYRPLFDGNDLWTNNDSLIDWSYINGTIHATIEANRTATNLLANEIKPVLPALELWQSIMVALIIAICMILTIGGNILVLLAFIVDRSIRQPSNYFIASLAATDMLIGTIIFLALFAFHSPFFLFFSSFRNQFQSFSIFLCFDLLFLCTRLIYCTLYIIHNKSIEIMPGFKCLLHATKRNWAFVLMVFSSTSSLFYEFFSRRNGFNAIFHSLCVAPILGPGTTAVRPMAVR